MHAHLKAAKPPACPRDSLDVAEIWKWDEVGTAQYHACL
jgi:hypothetical protein